MLELDATRRRAEPSGSAGTAGPVVVGGRSRAVTVSMAWRPTSASSSWRGGDGLRPRRAQRRTQLSSPCSAHWTARRDSRVGGRGELESKERARRRKQREASRLRCLDTRVVGAPRAARAAHQLDQRARGSRSSSRHSRSKSAAAAATAALAGLRRHTRRRRIALPHATSLTLPARLLPLLLPSTAAPSLRRRAGTPRNSTMLLLLLLLLLLLIQRRR